MLHWNQKEISNISSTFDLIVASDWYVLSDSIFPFQQECNFSLCSTVSILKRESLINLMSLNYLKYVQVLCTAQ